MKFLESRADAIVEVYARFSDDCFQCDVNIYERYVGNYVLHLAGRRKICPEVQKECVEYANLITNKDSRPDQIQKYVNLFLKVVDCDEWEDIPSSMSGTEKSYNSLKSLLDDLEEVMKEGFRVPAHVLKDIMDEVEKE